MARRRWPVLLVLAIALGITLAGVWLAGITVYVLTNLY